MHVSSRLPARAETVANVNSIIWTPPLPIRILTSQAASLGYDEHEHTWNRHAFEHNKESVAEYTALHPFIPAAAASNGTSVGISSGAISVAKTNSSARIVSSEPAGMLTCFSGLFWFDLFLVIWLNPFAAFFNN